MYNKSKYGESVFLDLALSGCASNFYLASWQIMEARLYILGDFI